MNPDFYKKLIQKSPVGYAYHKVLFDKNNKALDYIFLEVNSEFEELTGLKEEDIINKRITEITPDIREDKFDWINFYGEIALGGNEKEFIQYSKVFGKYYKILAYSPEEGHFVSLFSDLSNKIESQLQVKKVLESSEIFIKTDASKPNYQKILDLGLELSGAKFAMYNEFNEVDLDFTTVAFSGIGKSIKKVISILGFNPLGKHWKHDPV
ncbi:MAG: PAS domain-containing protein, partial [Bacteroidales bacterium]|nr:PAS domain-containing protein [Bacteroidales bacterium]